MSHRMSTSRRALRRFALAILHLPTSTSPIIGRAPAGMARAQAKENVT